MPSENKCAKCRRAGEKLFLKGERCFSQKCAVVRRAYAPGIHGKNVRRRVSEYGRQLAEKQKLRRIYGVSERQFENYFLQIVKQRGDKEEFLIQKLENRLDNVVFRLGWAKSRRAARQMVSHGNILLNGRRIDIPSYQVKKDDAFTFKEKFKKSPLFEELKATTKKHEAPVWLVLDKQKFEAKVIGLPASDEVGKLAEINMIIEYYSR